MFSGIKIYPFNNVALKQFIYTEFSLLTFGCFSTGEDFLQKLSFVTD